MLHGNQHNLTRAIEALFPREPEPLLPRRAADRLQAHLIRGVETAIEQGMRPADALAAVLCWVSTEMSRIGPDRAGNS